MTCRSWFLFQRLLVLGRVGSLSLYSLAVFTAIHWQYSQEVAQFFCSALPTCPADLKQWNARSTKTRSGLGLASINWKLLRARKFISSKPKGPGEREAPEIINRNFVSETGRFECRFPHDSYGRDRAPFRPFSGEGFWGNIWRLLVLPAPLSYCWQKNHSAKKYLRPLSSRRWWASHLRRPQ